MQKCFWLMLLFSFELLSQSYKLNGIVLNEDTKEPIPFVNIRIIGTTQGTSSNPEGKFVIISEKSNLKLAFTSVGFKKFSVDVNLAASEYLKIGLKPEPINFAEIVIGRTEDPAYAIIREAIKRKKQNHAGLNSLEYNLYSKNVLTSSGKVAMVSENYSTGYFKNEKREKVLIKSIHISENEKKSNLAIGVSLLERHYFDFTENELELAGSKVFLPLMDDAFGYYDYHLIKTTQTNDAHEFHIEVIPKSKIQPLLEGVIVIEDSTFSLRRVTLKAGLGVRVPFVNDFTAEFDQKLEQFEKYWLPTYFKSDFSLKMNFSNLITTGTISTNTIDVFTEYKINPAIPDSVFKLQSSLTKDEHDTTRKFLIKPETLTRAQIDSLRPIPLTLSEEKAYRDLDSSKKFITQLKFGGVFGGLAEDAVKKEGNKSSGGGVWSYLGDGAKYLRFVKFDDNRVNGISLGGLYDNLVLGNASFSGWASYTFGRKQAEGGISASYAFPKLFVNKIEVEYFNGAKNTQMLNPYVPILNTANVLLGFEDQHNYLLSKQFKISLQSGFRLPFNLKTDLIFEKQYSLSEMKYQSILRKNRIVRANPLIQDGNDNRISFGIKLGKNPQEFQAKAESGMVLQLDISNPLLGSDFNYKRVRFISQIVAKTFFKELLIAPYLQVGIEGGAVLGEFGAQHSITPNVALNIYAPFQSFKGLSPYEFNGDKMFALHCEHNWRTIPFQSVGLDFLTDLNIDAITGFSLLKNWNEKNFYSTRSDKKVYWEAYLGFGKILGVGRIDFCYTSDKAFFARAALSVIL